jgi:transcriptional regulator with XRE-family HTH domain
MISERIGDNIKDARTKKNLTQEALGKLVGCSGVAIMRYEKGERKVSLELVESIAKALDVSPFELMGAEYWDRKFPEVAEEAKLFEELISFLESLGYDVKEISEPIKVNSIEMESYSIELSKEGVSSKFTEEEFSQMQDEINNLIAFKVWEKRTKK